MSREPIRLAIVGSQGLFQEALAANLALEPDFRVTGRFPSVEQALTLLQVTEIDMLLLAIDFDRLTAAESLARFRAAGFHGSALMVTARASNVETLRQLRKDCAGVILQSQTISTLCQRIREIAGKPDASGAILRRSRRTEESIGPRLTARESDVLRSVLKGYSNKEIGAELGISENTVKTFLKQLFEKTGAKKRAHLVRMMSDPPWRQIKTGIHEQSVSPLVRAASTGSN